jgi:hypothetical protein
MIPGGDLVPGGNLINSQGDNNATLETNSVPDVVVLLGYVVVVELLGGNPVDVVSIRRSSRPR